MRSRESGSAYCEWQSSWQNWTPTRHAIADPLADAAEALSRDGIGALIAIQREVNLAPYIETGERIRYPVAREQWSVHYNVSRDGKLFAGDGGGPGSVANQTPLPGARRLDAPGNGQGSPCLVLRLTRPDAPYIEIAEEQELQFRFAGKWLSETGSHWTASATTHSREPGRFLNR